MSTCPTPAPIPGCAVPRPCPGRAVAFVTVLCAIVVAFTGCGSDDGGAPPEDSANVTETTAAGPDVTVMPSGVRWESYQGVRVPFGDDGPAHTAGSGAVSGFAHTPAGAALAAIQQSIRVGVAPDGQWAAVAAAGVAPGPQRDAYAVARIRVSITTPVVAAEAPRVLGYRFVDYTPGQAVVTIYTGFPDASLAATDVTVVWSGADWRLQLPAAKDAGRVRAVDTLPGATDRFIALQAAP